MKAFFKKYKNIKYLSIFFVIYMLGFLLLEKRISKNTIMTSTLIDQYIPFNEYFVIAYLLWFVFMALGFAYFVFIDQEGFKRTGFYLFTGMMISLLIYMIFPNGQDLRVELNNENVFQILVSFIYSIDSPTNVCPSIHVYNSIMMTVSLMKSENLINYKILLFFVVVLAGLICISTVLIKQHTFIDIIAVIMLAGIIYLFGNKQFKY